MNPQTPKNRLRQVEKSVEQEQTGTAQKPHEFASVEEMLRQDASQVQPPASIWERLKKNLAETPSAKPSWWRRWFS
jgi:hypothetical protein